MGVSRFLPRLEFLEDRTVPSTLTVLNNLDSGTGSLRDVIAHAKSGDTIVFAPRLDGQTITLTSDQMTINNSLDIEGPGSSLLAISGNDINRVFNINEGVTVTIAGLTLTHGRAGGAGESTGGGILNVGSSLTLADDYFSYNHAVNTASAGGGAVANRNGGTLAVTGCTFLGNQTIAGVLSEGGAIDSSYKGSALIVSDCTFTNNQAIGINGAEAGAGAIENDGDLGPITGRIDGCTFTNNTAIGGDGGVVKNANQNGPGAAYAGAVLNSGAGTTLSITNSSFTGNEAIGGNGGSGGKGLSIYLIGQAVGGAINNWNGANLIVDACNFSGNQAVGGSNATGGTSGEGRIGIANGGAVANLAIANITNSMFAANVARGGTHDTSLTGDLFVGAALGAGIASNPFSGSAARSSISNCMFSQNQAIGGLGNTGGPFSNDAIGGGLELRFGATATIAGTKFTGNQALAGEYASGNGADGLGGGVANILGSTLTVSGCMLTNNLAVGGAGGSSGNGGNGFGGGIFNDGLSIWPANAGRPAMLTVTGSTINGNQGTGGAAGTGGSSGQGIGGGVYFASGGVVCLDLFTSMNITGNAASTNNNDIFGVFMIC
jgi:hypothetical protein